MKITLLSILSVALAYSVAASAQDSTSSAIDMAARQAEASHQRQQQIADATAPIKSRADLNRYLSQMPKAQSPLAKLSPGAQSRFIQSLTFNEKGLTSYRHQELAIELSPTEIYKILSLFGAQYTASVYPTAKKAGAADAAILSIDDTLPGNEGDYPNKWCSSHATCSDSSGDTCIVARC